MLEHIAISEGAHNTDEIITLLHLTLLSPSVSVFSVIKYILQQILISYSIIAGLPSPILIVTMLEITGDLYQGKLHQLHYE